MEARQAKGTIFNIQHYAIHDGPGIRTTVFLKGCPLKCIWCQNPESQAKAPVLIFDPGKCTGCRACEGICPNSAIGFDRGISNTDRDLCRNTGECAGVCPAGARAMAGDNVTAGQVFEKVAQDSLFYETSGGGVTLSGGDPLHQPKFSAALLLLCKEAGFHTAVDTCGFAPWKTVKRVLEHADLVLFDFKHLGDARHIALTGVSNRMILENAKRVLHELGIPVWARIPVVPGHNDAPENMERTARFISEELDPSVPVHLIPFHRLGLGKYEGLGRPGPDVDCPPPGQTHLAKLQQIFSARGLTSVIGG